MLRTVALTIANEARLLVRDPMVLLMLLLAPVVIITVAGYSLGALYGGSSRVLAVPVVDGDGGAVAQSLVAALGREPTIRLEPLHDVGEARRRIGRSDHGPVALEIPAGTSQAIAGGRRAPLVLYVDPARRIEVNALELVLARLESRAAADLRARAQDGLDRSAADLHERAERLAAAIDAERSRMRVRRDRLATEAAAAETRIVAGLEQDRRNVEAALRRREAAARDQLATRQAVLERTRNYVRDLEAHRQAFAEWLQRLRAVAGRRADSLPAPPDLPPPPSDADLATLGASIEPPAGADRISPPSIPSRRRLTLPVPDDVAEPDPDLSGTLAALRAAETPVLPGDLDLVEQAATDGSRVVANAFDQYVPGFGVTFLLIGMMLGISLTLFDERDWGTLSRLRASGAPLAGVLVGKVIARVVVGVVQMVVLFAVGRALFGISLGRAPAALLLPTVGMSFAAAALGLVVPTLAHAHDSVMPLGTMTSLALSAIGGCWWPVDFEPPWLRTIAQWLPTTWTMRAYNDLMIRQQPPAAALWPAVATTALGLVFLAVGVAALVRTEDGR